MDTSAARAVRSLAGRSVSQRKALERNQHTSSPGITVLITALLLAGGCHAPEIGHSTTQPAPATTQPVTSYEYVEPKMGTVFRIVVWAKDKERADKASAAAYRRVDELNSILSDYDPQSELMKLSLMSDLGPMTQPVKVSKDLWKVLVEGQAAAEMTDGAFDVTIGPYTRLWRRSRQLHELPTPERLAQSRESVGHRHLKLFPEQQAVQLLAPKMRLDVGGIAKGYTADEAMRVIRSLGITQAMVGAAGDLRVGEAPPGKAKYRVAIQTLEKPDQVAGYVELEDYAISTSGDTYRFVEIDNVRYSHIINPATGLGLTQSIGVTVVAPNGMTSDWVSTALSVMGEKGLSMVERMPGVAARMTILNGDKNVVVESPRFREFVAAQSP